MQKGEAFEGKKSYIRNWKLGGSPVENIAFANRMA